MNVFSALRCVQRTATRVIRAPSASAGCNSHPSLALRAPNKARNTLNTYRRVVQTTIDVCVILAISFAAEATHFSYKQGRALICGDSAQYVTSAEALLSPDGTPHFEMRKPGYVFFLAGVSLVFGNMGWGAVTGHHVLLGLLPLAAYGCGRHLRSRWVGWLAAILTIARLQGVIWGERMLSEPLFTCLFSFGLLCFLTGLSRARVSHPRNARMGDGGLPPSLSPPPLKGRGTCWMLAAGSLLGLAWLTRGSASPIIAVAIAAVLMTTRHDWRRALASCAFFAAPILCCVAVECSLNLTFAGRFRPANGTIGATLLLRARHFEGVELPRTPEATRVLALLPERDRADAYIASHLDVWVARYHAVHNLGMDEWEYDKLMARVGWDALTGHFGAYLRSSLKMTLCHLFRRPDGQALSPVPEERRPGPLIHPAASGDDDWDTTWFAYWGLPHMRLSDSIALVDRMKLAASQRAPFGGSHVWRALRHWKANPVAESLIAGLTWLGSLWPGFALLGCGVLGLNRRTCVFLAAAYVFDALFIGFLTPTNARLQFIWIVVDTTLAATLVAGVVSVVTRRIPAVSRQQSAES